MFDKNVLGEYLEQYSEIYTGHPVLLGWWNIGGYDQISI
jgi:hypothetical protein